MKTAIILVNLGTPDEPTPAGVRRYLREFLSDTRVIEIPPFIWQIILNLFVLTTRPKRVSHAYQSVWTDEGSPLLAILKKQASLLQTALANDGKNIPIFPATTYGNPNIKAVMRELQDKGYDDLIVFSLYPQYSATTTGAVFDKVAQYCMRERNMPAIQFTREYYDHPLYIQALVESIKNHWQTHGRADRLLMSFHGIPKPYADKGDPYAEQCRKTAVLVASELGLGANEWAVSFQSRFGAQEWLKPYTDELLTEWGNQGVSVQVLSPAFSADCLETLEELAVENRDNFIKAGGKSYEYIPALNTDDLHIEMMKQIVGRYV